MSAHGRTGTSTHYSITILNLHKLTLLLSDWDWEDISHSVCHGLTEQSLWRLTLTIMLQDHKIEVVMLHLYEWAFISSYQSMTNVQPFQHLPAF